MQTYGAAPIEEGQRLVGDESASSFWAKNGKRTAAVLSAACVGLLVAVAALAARSPAAPSAPLLAASAAHAASGEGAGPPPATDYIWVVKHEPQGNGDSLRVEGLQLFTSYNQEAGSTVQPDSIALTATANGNDPTSMFANDGTYFEDKAFAANYESIFHFSFDAPVSLAAFQYVASSESSANPKSWTWFGVYNGELLELQSVVGYSPPAGGQTTDIPDVFLPPSKLAAQGANPGPPPPSPPPPFPPPHARMFYNGCIGVAQVPPEELPHATARYYPLMLGLSVIDVYCDFAADAPPAHFSYYACVDCPSVNKYTDPNGCTHLGMQLLIPRSKQHWEHLKQFTDNVLQQPIEEYMQVIGGVIKESSGAGECAEKGLAMNSEACKDGWRALDSQDWWLSDDPTQQPGDSYEAGCFLGLGAAGWNGDIDNIQFQANGCNYYTGTNYLCSTNEPVASPFNIGGQFLQFPTVT